MSLDVCIDCGTGPSHGTILLTRSVKIGRRLVHWKECSMCWKRRERMLQAEIESDLRRSMRLT